METAELIVRDIAYSPTERLGDMMPVILLAAAVTFFFGRLVDRKGFRRTRRSGPGAMRGSIQSRCRTA